MVNTNRCALQRATPVFCTQLFSAVALQMALVALGAIQKKSGSADEWKSSQLFSFIVRAILNCVIDVATQLCRDQLLLRSARPHITKGKSGRKRATRSRHTLRRIAGAGLEPALSPTRDRSTPALSESERAFLSSRRGCSDKARAAAHLRAPQAQRPLDAGRIVCALLPAATGLLADYFPRRRAYAPVLRWAHGLP